MPERMPERRVESGALIVGVDVAKRRHVAAFQGAPRFRRRGFAFANDRGGFEALLKAATDLGTRLDAVLDIA